MVDGTIFLEKILQNYRFKLAKPHLSGNVLDFGGNKGELKKIVNGKYLAVNYDHSAMEGMYFDTIVSLAVIEHVSVKEVVNIFQKFKVILNEGGRIFLTTPTKKAEPVLKFLASTGFIDKKNIREHEHYWNKKEIYDLAKKTGFVVKKYKKVQFGFNQLAILEHE